MQGKPEDRIGIQIAERYRVEGMIGAGGMGVVYRGVHLWTGRQVAVKLLSVERSEVATARFLREARAAASVRHPHLVEVLDVGEEPDGTMYLVLELLEGESLHAHIQRKGPLRAEDALDVVVPILDALCALHAAGVLHRDVKPDNIFLALEGGRVVPKLLDLGISKPLERGEVGLTRTGALIGTPTYMSPEQARGAPEVGVAADVWAVGVVLFECLRGEPPFSAETVAGMLHKIATERPPSLVETMPELPRAVTSAVDRALAYDASARPASAEAFADALVDAALAAGWPLTCRIPSGPRISLEPAAGPRDTSPSEAEPAEGPATAAIRRLTPGGSPAMPFDPTLEASSDDVRSASRVRGAATDAAADGGSETSEGAPDPDAAETIEREPGVAAPTLDRSPLRRPWIAVAAVAALALASGGIALAVNGRGSQPRDGAGEVERGGTELPAAAADPPAIDAGSPPRPSASAAAAEPAAPAPPIAQTRGVSTQGERPGLEPSAAETPARRRRPRHAPRPERPVTPDPPATPRDDAVELGPNAAPIIVD